MNPSRKILLISVGLAVLAWYLLGKIDGKEAVKYQ